MHDPLFGQLGAMSASSQAETQATSQRLQHWVTPAASPLCNTREQTPFLTRPAGQRGSALPMMDSVLRPYGGNPAHGACTNALVPVLPSGRRQARAEHDVAWSRIAGSADVLWPISEDFSESTHRSGGLPFWDLISRAFGPAHDLSDLDV